MIALLELKFLRPTIKEKTSFIITKETPISKIKEAIIQEADFLYGSMVKEIVKLAAFSVEDAIFTNLFEVKKDLSEELIESLAEELNYVEGKTNRERFVLRSYAEMFTEILAPMISPKINLIDTECNMKDLEELVSSYKEGTKNSVFLSITFSIEEDLNRLEEIYPNLFKLAVVDGYVKDFKVQLDKQLNGRKDLKLGISPYEKVVFL